jgi:hypothetical protein
MNPTACKFSTQTRFSFSLVARKARAKSGARRERLPLAGCFPYNCPEFFVRKLLKTSD